MNLAGLPVKLEAFGLHLRGALKLSANELISHQIETESDVSIALVGNIGSSYWPVFSQSREYRDGQTDPLDRWSKSVAEQVSGEIGAKPVYPFEGPPYYPFQHWANRAEALNQSPLGLMIHPQYGLWHSYRFGLLIAQDIGQLSLPVTSPCESCELQPCLNSCPVNAFGDEGYDVDRCAGYLNQNADARCHQAGCLARLACPVGEKYRYETAQHRFHLKAFLEAR